jgi:hypothetical protein
MTTPKYIEASRQAAREAQVSDRNPFGRIGRTCSALEQRCPDHVPVKRWVQAVKDAKCFLAVWGQQAESLGWCRPFGLHEIPSKPHPSYQRLSRYDATGSIWLLEGRPVVALTDSTAAIENPTGGHHRLSQAQQASARAAGLGRPRQ